MSRQKFKIKDIPEKSSLGMTPGINCGLTYLANKGTISDTAAYLTNLTIIILNMLSFTGLWSGITFGICKALNNQNKGLITGVTTGSIGGVLLLVALTAAIVSKCKGNSLGANKSTEQILPDVNLAHGTIYAFGTLGVATAIGVACDRLLGED